MNSTDLATDPQKRFISSLLSEREMTDEARAAASARLPVLTKALASAWIEKLQTLPKANQGARVAASGLPSREDLPAGRYAVENAEGELRFYRVARPRRLADGRVWLHVQHGPSESELPWNPATYSAILGAIVAAGPALAMQRYGFEIGHCGNCGARLTNRISRELGIGPVCGGRMFGKSEFSLRAKEARAAIVERGEDPDEEIEDDDGSDDFNARWEAHKNEFAAREREQERAAFAADRD